MANARVTAIEAGTHKPYPFNKYAETLVDLIERTAKTSVATSKHKSASRPNPNRQTSTIPATRMAALRSRGSVFAFTALALEIDASPLNLLLQRWDSKHVPGAIAVIRTIQRQNRHGVYREYLFRPTGHRDCDIALGIVASYSAAWQFHASMKSLVQTARRLSSATDTSRSREKLPHVVSTAILDGHLLRLAVGQPTRECACSVNLPGSPVVRVNGHPWPSTIAALADGLARELREAVWLDQRSPLEVEGLVSRTVASMRLQDYWQSLKPRAVRGHLRAFRFPEVDFNELAVHLERERLAVRSVIEPTLQKCPPIAGDINVSWRDNPELPPVPPPPPPLDHKFDGLSVEHLPASLGAVKTLLPKPIHLAVVSYVVSRARTIQRSEVTTALKGEFSKGAVSKALSDLHAAGAIESPPGRHHATRALTSSKAWLAQYVPDAETVGKKTGKARE